MSAIAIITLAFLHRLGHAGDVGLVEIGVGSLDRDLAAVRHGVASVQGKIENGVFELIRIGVGAPKTGRQHGFQNYGFTECPVQEIADSGNQLVRVENLWN